MSKKPRAINFTDNDILAIIRSIITEKPTYGYRRVCSILNYRIGPDKWVNHCSATSCQDNFSSL